jgi:hypothetical protein
MLLAAERKERRARAKETATELAKSLTEAEVKELLMPTREHLEAIRAIAAGRAPKGVQVRSGADALRHTGSMVQALKIMLEHTVSKPKQETGMEGVVQVVVNTLPAKGEAYSLPGATVMLPGNGALAALPAGDEEEPGA